MLSTAVQSKYVGYHIHWQQTPMLVCLPVLANLVQRGNRQGDKGLQEVLSKTNRARAAAHSNGMFLTVRGTCAVCWLDLCSVASRLHTDWCLFTAASVQSVA